MTENRRGRDERERERTKSRWSGREEAVERSKDLKIDSLVGREKEWARFLRPKRRERTGERWGGGHGKSQR